MSLSEKRIIFGVHQVTPYSRTTGKPYGTLKCLKSSSLSLSGESIDLNAGSNKYAWASEDSKISAEMSLKFSEYPAFLFELFLGKAPTENGADTAGSVSTPVEFNGTSIMDATNGISAVAVIPSTGAANLKSGKYTAVATDTNKIDIYAHADIDFTRGTDVAYQDDALKINASAITIATGSNDVASIGLRFTGIGTPAFTVGDTITFEVKAPSSRSMEVTIGSLQDAFPEFGAVIVSQKRGNGEITIIDAFKCKGAGMPLGFEQGAFSESEVKCKMLYDTDKNGVFKFLSVSA